MKYLSDYTKDATSIAMEKYGAFFAFSVSQFNEKRVEGVAYAQDGSGMIAPKENFKALVEELNKIHEDGIKQDIAENGIEAIIRRELNNHECDYTGDVTDAVDALEGYGVSHEQVLNVYRGIK